MSKLHRLIKLFRLIRLLKLMKKQEQIMNKMKEVIKVGQTLERLSFFVIMLFIATHFVSCCWILIAKLQRELGAPAGENATSWIMEGEYEEANVFELYTLAFYFTIQTLTTVGYGDFSIKSHSEKFMTIMLQLLGIIFFSFVSGAITNII